MKKMKNAKKIPYYLLLSLLTGGASLIIGFLSFGGMFALWPILPLAFGALALSVVYEIEIYLQKIRSAFKKLKPDFLKYHLANEYLCKNFPDTTTDECPQFFKDYKIQFELLQQFGHARLDKESQARKKRVEKTLKDMEKWFALQLFTNLKEDKSQLTNYQLTLRDWLAKHGQDEANTLLKRRTRIFNGVKIFSLLSAFFAGFGTTYLLLGAFASIPLLASIPFAPIIIILPMAFIAGAAWGFLTYDTITDMINNDTLRKLFLKIYNDLKERVTLTSVFMAIAAVVLLGLAVALTICTAGTWWTVAKNAPRLFVWMTAIISGVSTLSFSLENTGQSLKIIRDFLKSQPLKRMINKISTEYVELNKKENWIQIINPARILLYIVMTPLRLILFLGHVISIGVTSDRVPGIPPIPSAALGAVDEIGQDLHFFFGHDHEHHHEDFKHALKERLQPAHGHDHSDDIPTKLLKLLLTPVTFLAAVWDYWASKRNKSGDGIVLETFKDAWNKHNGTEPEVEMKPESSIPLSKGWLVERTIYRIDKHKQKHLANILVKPDVADDKTAKLTALQNDLRGSNGIISLKERIEAEASESLYKQHRHPFFSKGKTRTQDFLEQLPEQIGAPAV